MIVAALLLAKIFLCMVLYGKITVYQILRKNSDFAAFFMLVVLFVHLAARGHILGIEVCLDLLGQLQPGLVLCVGVGIH